MSAPSVVTVVRFTLAVVAIVGNMFLIGLFVFHRRLRCSQCHWLGVMLNVCDLIIVPGLGMGVFVSSIYFAYSEIQSIELFDRTTCYLVSAVQGFGIFGSQVVLVGIGLDRLMALWRPIKYSASRSFWLPVAVAVMAVLCAFSLFALKPVHVVGSQYITVCTTGAVSGHVFVVAHLIFNTAFLLLFCGVYVVAVIMFCFRLRGGSCSAAPITSYQQKMQMRMFASVSVILLANTLFYGVPLALNVIVGIFGVFPDFWRTWISRGIGYGTLVCSVLNVFIYLLKYPDVKKCAHSTVNRFLANRVGWHFVSAPSVNSSWPPGSST